MWLVILIIFAVLTTWSICVISSEADDRAEEMSRQDKDDENSEK